MSRDTSLIHLPNQATDDKCQRESHVVSAGRGQMRGSSRLKDLLMPVRSDLHGALKRG